VKPERTELAGARTTGEGVPPGSELIDIHLADLTLLFNAMDHSPLRERDLDPKAEEFIVSSARAARGDATLALRIYVDRLGVTEDAAVVPQAVHEYFRQRSLSARRRLSQLFRVGRTSLLIGIAFLAVAVTLAGFVERALSNGELGALIRESIVIGGWVAMWRPLEIFLYDWWPIRAERKLFDVLSAMPVSITSRGL
jgi:hypothetical protein